MTPNLCEEVIESNSSHEDKLRALKAEFRTIVRGVHTEVTSSGRETRYNLDGNAAYHAEDIIGEIDYALKHHKNNPRLKELVKRYEDYLFMISQRAYEGEILSNVFDRKNGNKI